MKTLLRFFFGLLYHQFAFAYDLVAATVSLNRWKDWVTSVIPFLAGRWILEIGYGPGHLQRALLHPERVVVGIDESAQMGRLAKHNIRRGASSVPANHQAAYTQNNLTRGIGQQLPFPHETFDSVVATFPAKYIFELDTLTEVKRVLIPGGRFVVLPGAIIVGRGILDRLLAWVFRITGEAPANLSEIIHEGHKKAFAEAGFHMETHEVRAQASLMFIMVATKHQIVEEVKHVSKTT